MVFQPIACTLLYYPLRMRKEGYDIVLRMEPQESIYSSHRVGKDHRLLFVISLLIILVVVMFCVSLFPVR